MARFSQVLTVALGGLLFSAVRAEDTSPIAVAQLTCKGSKAACPEEEQQLVGSVKNALMEKYLESLPPERKPAVEARKAVLLSNLDRYLENFTVRSRQFDKKTRVYTLAAQADVNTTQINQLIDQGAGGEKSPVVFIFVARRQAEVESRGPQVTTGTKETSAREAQAEARSSGGLASESSATKTSQAVTSASSETRFAERITYVLEDNAKSSIDSTISKVLVDRGFDVASAAELVDAPKGQFNPDVLQKDFETSSQFSLEHQRLATRRCREAGALLAYGTLTIGVKRLDPANNRNTIINVLVEAQIFDCRKPLAVKVGSIGALQVEGIGADQTQAETAAIEKAATSAANTLADQLRNRGIR